DASSDGTYGSAPVATTFNGSLEGLGNAISNLSIECESGRKTVALFAATGSAAAIKSVRLQNFSYINNARRSGGTGGLVAQNLGYLFDDHVQGAITGTSGAGGDIGILGSPSPSPAPLLGGSNAAPA